MFHVLYSFDYRCKVSKNPLKTNGIQSPLYNLWQFHYTKCGNSVILNVDCSATIRGTLHEGGLEPSREILEVRIMKVMQRSHLNDNLHQLREAFLSDEERKERGHPDCSECPLIFHHNGYHPREPSDEQIDNDVSILTDFASPPTA